MFRPAALLPNLMVIDRPSRLFQVHSQRTFVLTGRRRTTGIAALHWNQCGAYEGGFRYVE